MEELIMKTGDITSVRNGKKTVIKNPVSISSMIEDGYSDEEIAKHFKDITPRKVKAIRVRNDQWKMDGIMMK